MQIRSGITMKASLKAMQEVIMPAIDPENSMALEQAQMIIGLLTLLNDRRDLQTAYDIDALRRCITLGTELLAYDNKEQLRADISAAQSAIEGASAIETTLTQHIAILNSHISTIADQLCAKSDEENSAARRLILKASAEQNIRERSWLLMQGWEPQPENIPDISALLFDIPTKGEAYD